MSKGLRLRAEQLFGIACQAADPARALAAAVKTAPLPRPDPGGAYRVVAIGKAAVPMAEWLLGHLAGVPVQAIVVTNYENARALSGARVMAAGHPMPDDNGAAAAAAVIGLLDGASAADQVIALISGGASALVPAPLAGLTLADKADVNRLLLASGFDITETNLVRQQLSQLKGGGLARLASPARLTGFVLSDVIGDDLRVVASGPTTGPIGTRAMARDLIRKRGLWEALPDPVRAILGRDALPTTPAAHATNILIGSNRKSLDAVAAAAGPEAMIVNDRLIGDVADAARQIVQAALAVPPGSARCCIFGGETTVQLRGTGMGGRNQELALRVALAMPNLGRDWVFLSGGTDGRDGPTDAAGGVVDAGTAGRIRAAGADPVALLANNNSYAALRLAGDRLIVGATGTNVADVQILMIETDG